MAKPVKCKYCGSGFHYSFACGLKPKHCTHCDEIGHARSECIILKRHKLENGRVDKIDPKTKRYPDVKKIKKAGKYTRRWMQTRTLWLKQNPPNHQGLYKCHYCPALIPTVEMTLDHKQSRSRHPELRYELSNLVPSCAMDNGLKGSRSHDEFCTVCPPLLTP